jgi:hypothetical protein
MKKKLNLTIDSELYNLIKRKKVNASRLVEKLLFKHCLPINPARRAGNVGSNPARGTLLFVQFLGVKSAFRKLFFAK